jgi:hypothetical protein
VSNNPIRRIDSTGTQDNEHASNQSNAHSTNFKPQGPQIYTTDDFLRYLNSLPNTCQPAKTEAPDPPMPPKEATHPLKVDVSGEIMKTAKKEWNAPNATVADKAAVGLSVAAVSPLYLLELTLNIPDTFETVGEHLGMLYTDSSHGGYHLLMGSVNLGAGVLALTPLKGVQAGSDLLVLNIGGELDALPGEVVLQPGRQAMSVDKLRTLIPNTIIEAKAESIPLGGNVAELIKGQKLPNSIDWSKASEEFKRVLAPGGKVDISVYGPAEELEQQLTLQGFQNVENISNVQITAQKPSAFHIPLQLSLPTLMLSQAVLQQVNKN